MRNVRCWLCGFLAGVMLLSLVGCKQEVESTPIVVALSDDIVSLDVAGTKDILSETVARCVYTTLYTFDEKLNLVPCLAEGAERVSDLEWVFQIKQNAKFHDGTPLTASDVKFSLDRARTIELAEKALLIIDNVEVEAPYTLRVTTTEPCANLPSVFVRVSTSVMSEKALSNPDYDFNHPVGSGPFRVLERTEGSAVRMERFDDYFLGRAATQFLTFVVEPSEQNSTASLLNDKIDVVFRVPAADCDYLKLYEGVAIYESDSTKVELFAFNPDKAPLGDIRVRQAIACAIDKQKIVDNVIGGYGKTISSMLPPPLVGSIEFDGYTYDPERAKALLTEAGYPNGFKLTVLAFDAQRKALMEYLRLDLAQVGIELSYEFLELQDYLDLIEQNQYMSTLMSWTSNADPDSTLSQLYSKQGHITVNHSKFTDERVEALILQGKMATDQQKRLEIYEEANRIIAQSYHVIPIYRPSVLVAAGSDIRGVRINPQGIFSYESLYREKAI